MNPLFVADNEIHDLHHHNNNSNSNSNSNSNNTRSTHSNSSSSAPHHPWAEGGATSGRLLCAAAWGEGDRDRDQDQEQVGG